VDDFQSIVLIAFWPVMKMYLYILNFWYHMKSEVKGEESNISQVAFKVVRDNLMRG
jgi:hypothetical protein